MKNKKVIVIGGGPAGMMAAIAAGEYSQEVILMEKNPALGKKLKITGGGRCNVTNIATPAEILEKVASNGKFLYKSLHTFTSKTLMELIEERGCPLKVEEEGKVFPKSDSSNDIIKVFDELIKEKKIRVYYQYEVKEVLSEENRVIAVKTSDQQLFTCDAVILATGGISYPHTGSTGEGHIISKSLGHKISPLKPSLSSMEIKEKWLTELTGISFKDVSIKTKIGKKTISTCGDILFTHYGVSGPSVFQLSAHLNKLDLSQGGHNIFIDFVPNVTEEALKEIFILKQDSNKKITTILTEYWPKKFITKVLEVLKIEEKISFSELTKKDRNKLINALKHFNITILQLRSVKDAIVTSGGVAVKEVNPSTMESKLIKGLFFAGEVLDVDALTGGYNLQIAFSTGYVAGINSSQ